MNTNRAAALTLAILCTIPAFAEDLRPIGTLNPANLKVYADKDSISRRAHLSTINLLILVTPKQTEKVLITFDCEEKKYFLPDASSFPLTSPFRWVQEGVQYALSDEALPNAFSLACKAKWEFWK